MAYTCDSLTAMCPLSLLPGRPWTTLHTLSPGRTLCTKFAGKKPTLSPLLPWKTQENSTISQHLKCIWVLWRLLHIAGSTSSLLASYLMLINYGISVTTSLIVWMTSQTDVCFDWHKSRLAEPSWTYWCVSALSCSVKSGGNNEAFLLPLVPPFWIVKGHYKQSKPDSNIPPHISVCAVTNHWGCGD